MKFIIDAQLPYLLKEILIKKGYDVLHTLDLPKQNTTTDIEIIKLSENENRIVITKDGDFLKYFLVHNIPKRILLISTGNIKNRKLLDLIRANITEIVSLFLDNKMIIELDNQHISVHY